LDLNNGLTQILSYWANTYLYGVDCTSQENTEGIDYFLGAGAIPPNLNKYNVYTITPIAPLAIFKGATGVQRRWILSNIWTH